MSSILPETRVRILNAARKLLEDGQSKTVRMVDIARTAQVSRQALYLEFENRSHLIAATRNFVDEQYGVAERISIVLKHESATARLRAYIEFWANYLPHIYGLARAMQIGSAIDEAAAAAWQECQDDHFKVCLNIVHHLDQQQLLAADWTVEAAAQTMMVILSLDGWAELTINRNWGKQQYITNMTNMILGGLMQ